VHQPQRGRRLVDGDEVAGVEGAEEEGLPALGAGQHGRRVVAVGVAVAVEAPDVERRGEDEHAHQRGAQPQALTGTAPEQPPDACGDGCGRLAEEPAGSGDDVFAHPAQALTRSSWNSSVTCGRTVVMGTWGGLTPMSVILKEVEAAAC